MDCAASLPDVLLTAVRLGGAYVRPLIGTNMKIARPHDGDENCVETRDKISRGNGN